MNRSRPVVRGDRGMRYTFVDQRYRAGLGRLVVPPQRRARIVELRAGCVKLLRIAQRVATTEQPEPILLRGFGGVTVIWGKKVGRRPGGAGGDTCADAVRPGARCCEQLKYTVVGKPLQDRVKKIPARLALARYWGSRIRTWTN